MQDFLKEYESLRPFIFPNISNRLQETDTKGSDFLRKIFFTNRQSFYQRFASNYIDYQRNNILFNDYLTSANETPVDSLTVINPIQAQGFSQFLQSIYSNSPVLVDAVCKNMNNHNFNHIINIVIPALYGFFSTKEQSAAALTFYTCMSANADFQTYCNIVAPFFCNANIDSFCEKLIDSVFFSNYLKKFNASRFCDLVINKLQKLIRFLPTSQFQLIRFLSLNWENSKVWKLIIQCLIIPAFQLNVPFNPFAQSPLVDFEYYDFIDELKKFESFPTLNLSVSWPLEIPGDFVFFNETFTFELTLTKFDLDTISSFHQYVPYHGARLPDIVRDIKTRPFQPFRVIVYPKIPIPPRVSARNLFFEQKSLEIPSDNHMAQLWVSIKDTAESERIDPINLIQQNIKTGNQILNEKLDKLDKEHLLSYGVQSELSDLYFEASNFEKLLTHTLELSRLRMYFKSCIGFQKKVSMRLAKRTAIKIKGKYWQTIDKMIGPGYSRLYTALVLLDQGEQEFLKPIKADLTNLEKKFNQVKEDSMLTLAREVSLGSTTAQSLISENNVLLSIVNDDSPFLSRATVLLHFLHIFSLFCQTYSIDDTRDSFDQMLHYAIAMNGTSWLLKTVILLDGVLFGDPKYESSIGKMYLESWQKFKASFLQYIAVDGQLLDGYIKLSGEGILTSAN